jgi:hypothetical protein
MVLLYESAQSTLAVVHAASKNNNNTKVKAVSVKDSFQMIIYNVKIICLFEQDNSLC